MISQGRNAVISVWWRPHLKRTTWDLHLNFLFSTSTWSVVHLKIPLYQYPCEKLVINNFHIINIYPHEKLLHKNVYTSHIHMKSCHLKISTLSISMWKIVHKQFPHYQYPHEKRFIKKIHTFYIYIKSCPFKISTLSTSAYKVI